MSQFNWGDSIKFETKFAQGAADGTFSGYGAYFGNVDSYGDVIGPKAFKETLRDWKKMKSLPPMLLNHGGGFLGSPQDDLPIGVWTKMEEDDNGLFVEGVLNTRAPRGAEVYSLMKMDPRPGIDGLSIGFRVKGSKIGTKPEEPKRTLTAIELIELSVVTMPANGKARISDVKAAEHIKTIRDYEDFLRDVGGFSHARAKAIALHGFKAASEPRDEDEGQSTLIARQLARLASFHRSLSR
jgi:hypothetical protein